MRLTLRSPRPLNLHVFLTRAGYHRSRDGGSYIRRLGRGSYPRFHVYVQNEASVVSLHLDQKAVSYEGVKRHSGEADSSVVREEAERLLGLAARFGT